MAEPSIRTSRHVIGTALLAVVIVGGGGFLAGRATVPAPKRASLTETAAQATTPAPSAPEPRAALGRADIIALAQQAADAFASGFAVPERVEKAGGRRFDVVIPFGCSGPTEPARSATGWQYDREEETLRVSVTPSTWQGAEWGASGRAADVVKGFWITRPWSGSDDCPPHASGQVPDGAETITLPGQTLAIAQFIDEGANSTGWRGDRPFEVVKRMTAASRFDERQGLRLRVKGRIDGNRRGGSVLCTQPAGIEQRPICAVVVQLEEVEIELPSGETLGTWPVDSAR